MTCTVRSAQPVGSPSMRRLLVAIAALALAAQACGGGAGTTTTTTMPATTSAPASTTTTTEPAGLTFASDDGAVTLDVPAEALNADPGIAITALDPTDLPEFDIPFVPVWLYSFEPTGLSFDAPATVTFEIPLSALGEIGEGQLPLVSLVSTAEDGNGWELLEAHHLRRTEDTVVVSAEITHFSSIAALGENVMIEVELVQISMTPLRELGFDSTLLGPDDRPVTTQFLWSNGVPLMPPEITSAALAAGSTELQVDASRALLVVRCLPSIGAVDGHITLELALEATDNTSGITGLTSAPAVTTLDGPATFFADLGIQLVCRPTIGRDGSVRLTFQVDHPGGEVFIPNENFLGGASGALGLLDRAIPGLLAGLIRDDDSNGQVSPTDTMYPPLPAEVMAAATQFVNPLYGFDDYFLYFIDTRDLETTVLLPDGATTVLGGLTSLREKGVPDDRVAIPMLGDLPFIGRVFSEESRTEEDVELVILVTPTLVQPIDD